MTSLSGVEAPLWFVLPEGFLPLSAFPDQEALDGLRAALAEQGRTAHLRAVNALAATLDRLRANDVIHLSLGLHPGAQGDVTSALLTVSLQPTRPANRRLVVTALLEALAPGESSVKAELTELPCGPALFLEKTQKLEIVDDVAAVLCPDGVPPLQQFIVGIAHPDGRHAAVFTLSTGSAAYHEEYRQIMLGIAYSVTFTDPQLLRAQERADESMRKVFG